MLLYHKPTDILDDQVISFTFHKQKSTKYTKKENSENIIENNIKNKYKEIDEKDLFKKINDITIIDKTISNINLDKIHNKKYNKKYYKIKILKKFLKLYYKLYFKLPFLKYNKNYNQNSTDEICKELQPFFNVDFDNIKTISTNKEIKSEKTPLKKIEEKIEQTENRISEYCDKLEIKFISELQKSDSEKMFSTSKSEYQILKEKIIILYRK